jgi:DNA invertase Pin-like site-specific DNA recombinase
MIYGYARVSTAGQAMNGNSLEDQENKLKEAGAEKIYSEHYTGTKIDRPEFDKVLKELKSGDTLTVTKLDRFARTANDGYNMIKELMEKNVSVNILNMGIANNSAMGKLMLQVILAFGEFERDMIVERTTAGKAVARQREGYKEGRPKLDSGKIAQIKGSKSWKEAGVSRSTWYKYRTE